MVGFHYTKLRHSIFNVQLFAKLYNLFRIIKPKKRLQQYRQIINQKGWDSCNISYINYA